MNYLDLFSGIGGFALGAYWAGFRCEKHYFSDIEKYAVKHYQKRFPDSIPLGDITKINGKELKNGNSGEWIITGGFSCQDISLAGKSAGLEGERSGLWFEYARLIGELRPSYAIMENVGALVSRGLDRVLGSLAKIGYDAEWCDIRASDIGAPHERERIWIVAYPNGARLQKRNISSIADKTSRTSERDNATFQGWDERKMPQPAICRVADGVSTRVGRLKGLGNAIVHQISKLIFQEIIKNETLH